jgi:ribosomal protein S18 acetylase RimI-like enzyme
MMRMDHTILLKRYLSEADIAALSALEAACVAFDRTGLKLELDWKRNRARTASDGMKEIDEFLHCVDGEPVAYLGICSFGGRNVTEINGMTHPDHRRKGSFGRLYDLAVAECARREFDKVLLLADGKSASGRSFIESVGGTYEFSEYRMRRTGATAPARTGTVRLRKACDRDAGELLRQDAIYFGHSTLSAAAYRPEEDARTGRHAYLSEVGGAVVGKIVITYEGDGAFISGVGVLPEHRSRGYARASLAEALAIAAERGVTEVELDVETKNDGALHLYRSCGFQERSRMDYYRAPMP